MLGSSVYGPVDNRELMLSRTALCMEAVGR